MSKETENNWKEKAIIRSKEKKELNKELVRQKERAEKWRNETYLLRGLLADKDLAFATANITTSLHAPFATHQIL